MGSEVRFVYLLTNTQHSPTAYTIDPVEHYRAWKAAEARGWELIGAFHSHPSGPTTLSLTDLALANEPEWFYLVVTTDSVRAFKVVGRRAEEVEIVS
jgi:[CysO sulfur-carrier protein]-S-L-cysteine hydrolase